MENVQLFLLSEHKPILDYLKPIYKKNGKYYERKTKKGRI